jgi:hypothetical protein
MKFALITATMLISSVILVMVINAIYKLYTALLSQLPF